MNSKKVIFIFVIGILFGLFLVSPTLHLFGFSTFDTILVYLFGDNTILAIIFTIITMVLIIIGVYKIVEKGK